MTLNEPKRHETDQPSSFDDIRKLLKSMPAFDQASADQARQHDQMLTKPPGALGRLEELAIWLAGWQHSHPPRLGKMTIAIFAANHGVTKHPVSAFPSAVTAQMVGNFAQGGAAINQLADVAGANLQVIDVGVENPTRDFSEQPAMKMSEFCEAFVNGWKAVPIGIDLFAIGEMGIGNTTAAAALCNALFGGDAMDWTGPGTGVQGDGLATKIAIVSQSVDLHLSKTNDPLELFAALGGKEMAAIAGAVMAARAQNVPVIIDGYIATAAIAPLFAYDQSLIAHCWPGHRSAEPAHDALISRMSLPAPLLDLGMRLGEGSGAALALNIVKAAIACHNQMATFEKAGVSEKTKGAP